MLENLMTDAMMDSSMPPTRPRTHSLWSVLAGLKDRARGQHSVACSLVALDWDDEHAVLGWVPEALGKGQTATDESRTIAIDQIEFQTHAIPDGLMVEGQWQVASRWLACLERWVAATDIDHPQLVLAMPAKNLSHHWLNGPATLEIDRTDVLMGLVDKAMSQQALDEHGQVSLDDQVFDVLPERDVWPGTSLSFAESEGRERHQRWCLVGVAEAKVAALEALFAGSHLSLACLDSRPRALLAAWHPHLSNEGHACLLDDHLSITQWMVTGGQGIAEMGQLSHRRLSMAERVDHLIGRLGSAQASHSFDTIWVSHPEGSELAEVASRVADTLNLSVAFMPGLGDHKSSASLQLVVQGLLIGQATRVITHAF